MIDKPLFVIITMYILSFSLLGVQYVADSYGVTILAPDGTPLKAPLLETVRTDTVNTIISNVTTSNRDSFILDAIVAGATIAWEFFILLTGTYIFNLLILFGIPQVFVTGIVIVYSFLMINTLIAKIRGV